MDEKSIQEGKPLAWLSYVSILFIVPLLAQKDNPYCKFHVKQGIILFIAGFIWGAATKAICFLPMLGLLLAQVGWLFLLVLTVIGIINALTGKTEKLPVLGQYADKLNF
ncbi:MAG TPA: hypothetical protein PKX93_05210 [bacterium]|nr:hypothetical protein [bacterium]